MSFTKKVTILRREWEQDAMEVKLISLSVVGVDKTEMVNFVKPNLMGTRKEFMNRFVNPIVNGQHSDSTERDIRMMKKRSFILNDLLKGCMQRLDYNVLVPYLMPKQEYVITIQLTDLQKKLYRY